MHAGEWAAAHLHQGLCLNVLVIRPLICSFFAASFSFFAFSAAVIKGTVFLPLFAAIIWPVRGWEEVGQGQGQLPGGSQT